MRKKDQLFSILTKMKIDHIIKVSIDTFGEGGVNWRMGLKHELKVK